MGTHTWTNILTPSCPYLQTPPSFSGMPRKCRKRAWTCISHVGPSQLSPNIHTSFGLLQHTMGKDHFLKKLRFIPLDVKFTHKYILFYKWNCMAMQQMDRASLLMDLGPKSKIFLVHQPNTCPLCVTLQLYRILWDCKEFTLRPRILATYNIRPFMASTMGILIAGFH